MSDMRGVILGTFPLFLCATPKKPDNIVVVGQTNTWFSGDSRSFEPMGLK